MALAFLTTLAALIGLGCVLLSWSHVRRIGEANSDDLGALTIALKKTPEAERLHELGRRARPASWEHRLAAELIEAPSDAAKIAAVNDALIDLDHTFRLGAAWPTGAIRISLWGGMLLGVSSWLDAGNLPVALGIVLIGGISAAACFEAERSAKRRVLAQRRAVDDLVTAAVGRLVIEEGALPPERRSRRKSAR